MSKTSTICIFIPCHNNVLLLAAWASQSSALVCVCNIVCHCNHFEYYISLDRGFFTMEKTSGVLVVPIATRRMRDGQMVTLDGGARTVTLQKDVSQIE